MSVQSESIYAKPPLQSREKEDVGVRAMLRFVFENRWLALILLAHLPLVMAHLSGLWKKPEYQFFPLVLVTVGYLVWTRAERFDDGVRGPNQRKLAYALLIMSLAICIVANFVIYSPWLGMVSFVLAAGGVFLVVSETFYICNAFGIWLMLWLTVPFPLKYSDRVSRALQRFTTDISAQVLETIGIPNIADGTILTLATKQLFVEEACSGIVSMMSILACGLIIAAISNRSLIHLLLLVVSGLAWAATTNTLRIVTLAFAHQRLNVDLTEGWRHDILGMVLFGVAMLFVLSTDRLLSFMIGPAKQNEFSENPTTWSVQWWDKLTSLGIPKPLHSVIQTAELTQPRKEQPALGATWMLTLLGVVFFIVGIASTAVAVNRVAKRTRSEQRMAAGTFPFVRELREDSVPQSISGWQRDHFSASHAERLFAQDSRVWTYHRDDLEGVFAMDFSFDSWHNLCVCYQMVGWSQKQDYRVLKPTGDDSAIFLEAEFEKESGQQGYLLFSLVEYDGKPYEPADIISEHRGERYQPPTTVERLMNRIWHDVEIDDRRLFQFQLWIASPRTINREERMSAQELFQTVRKQLRRQLSASFQSSDVPFRSNGQDG